MSKVAAVHQRVVSLLREHRYRRHFVRIDAKQNATGIVIISIALLLTVRNDWALLRDTSMFAGAIVAKVLYLIVASASLAWMRRGTRPRQVDSAYALWFVALAVVLTHNCGTRFLLGEVQGPAVAHGTLLCVIYFAQRGPILLRGINGTIITILSLVLLWNPHAAVSSAGQVTGTIAFIALNVIGVMTARSFEEQRRKRFDAEQQERRARTQLTQKMAELAREKIRAETMARARTAFLAAMSHEFRTPMNAVLGFSELLLALTLENKPHEYARAIRESARGLLGLLNDVLDFAKIDADKLVLASVPFDLRGLAASVIAMMEPLVSARPITISLELSPDVPDFVLGDDLRLRQVLVNLLSNAAKFTERGHVRLCMTANAQNSKQHEVTFRVEDSGMGMTADVVARLFQPFEQGDQGIARRHQGTGLGLAISKRIVQAMGGDIHVLSEPGRGTVFSFTIPVVDTGPVTPLTGRTIQELRATFTILVVDDHPINRRVATAMLEKIGYVSDVAEDGPAALRAVANKEYDIIFMDLHMPGMSGIEATTQILNTLDGRRVPHIVAMTASVFEEDRAACRNAGMQDFVAKPIDLAQIDKVLRRIAQQRKPMTELQSPTIALDPEALANLRELETSAEPGFVASILREFLIDTPDRLDRLRVALEAGNATEVRLEAHTLKSTTKSLGATEMSALCARIENAARAGELQDLDQWVEALRTEFRRLEPVIAREIVSGTKT